MQISENIINHGLLAELAYLRLEDEYWTTPGDEGNIPSYSNMDDLSFFLKGINPKTDRPYSTNIDDSRDDTILNLLSNYTIIDFESFPSGMQAMTLKDSSGNLTVAFRGTETQEWSEIVKDVSDDGEMAFGHEIDQMVDVKQPNIKASFYSLFLFLVKSNQKIVRRDSFLNPFYNFKKSDSAELELKFSNSPRITSNFFHLQKGKLKSHLNEHNLIRSVA